MTGTVNRDVDIQDRLDRLRGEGGSIQDAISALSQQWHDWLGRLQQVHELLRAAPAPHPQPSGPRGSGLLTSGGVSQREAQVTPPPQNADASVADAPAVANSSGLSPDDEALLATLDERTAALARVRRRLSMNTRSIRECLAEIQSERDKPQRRVENKKSQWWS